VLRDDAFERDWKMMSRSTSVCACTDGCAGDAHAARMAKSIHVQVQLREQKGRTGQNEKRERKRKRGGSGVA
jgi:hypothetical protein